MPPPKPYREWNDLAAYQFDNAILFGGLVIENASQERKKIGDEDHPRYTLEQLLDPDFRLPGSPLGAGTNQQGVQAIAVANPGIIGHWKEAQPGEVVQ